MNEYWLNFGATRRRYRLEDIGCDVDTGKGFPLASIPYGGEGGLHYAENVLYCGEGMASFFDGRCLMLTQHCGKQIGMNPTDVNPGDYLLYCLIFNNKAFIVIDKDGYPVTARYETYQKRVTPRSHDGIKSGAIIDLASARSFKRDATLPTD